MRVALHKKKATGLFASGGLHLVVAARDGASGGPSERTVGLHAAPAITIIHSCCARKASGIYPPIIQYIGCNGL